MNPINSFLLARRKPDVSSMAERGTSPFDERTLVADAEVVWEAAVWTLVFLLLSTLSALAYLYLTTRGSEVACG